MVASPGTMAGMTSLSPHSEPVHEGALDAPLAAPWPASARRAANGAVSVAGVDLTALAAEAGTPLYVLDEGEFRGRAKAFVAAFTEALGPLGVGVDVYYAGKALLCSAVARWAHESGLRVDTATGGELAVALRAGVPGAHIGLHGNNKSDSEIERALRAGVGRIVIDSRAEVDRVARAAARLGVVAPVMVRITTGVHAGGHEHIATAHEDQKFGVSLASGEAEATLDAALACPDLRVLGLHSHIGSQILASEGFVAAAEALLGLRARVHARHGVLLDELDLGGGFGIAYLPGEADVDLVPLAATVAGVLRQAGAASGLPLPRISFEPGRWIVGRAGATLYTVGTVKTAQAADGGQRRYVAVDGGMSDSIRPALYGAKYTAIIASRSSDAPPMRARVVGKHCETGDFVVTDVDLPADIAPGDLLAVPATGAYGRSMASNYNLVPRPPVVAVRDGQWRTVVRRESEEDLLALDVG